MSMSNAKKFPEARLALFEHLKGELMLLMDIVPSEFKSKEELTQRLDEVGDVAEAILEALNIEVVEMKEGKIHAVIDIGELD